MKIIAIDPGYERLGIAVLEKNGPKEELVFSECLKTSAKIDHAERLKLIGEELEKIIKKFKPSALAIETLFFSKNQKTAMQVSEARGVILSIIAKNKIKLCEFTPAQIKKAVTGDGKADKKAVEKMICLLLGLKKSPRLDDASDALAIALTAASLADR